MTVVEVTDAHGGFEVVTSRIRAKLLRVLAWQIAFIAFFLSAMGLEKIRFFWYVRNISLLAFLGYLAGAAVYLLQYRLLH